LREIEILTGMNRAELLRRASAAGAVFGLAPLIAACSGNSASTSGGTTTTAAPKKGGNLRVGMVGNGRAETLNPGIGLVPIEAARAYSLFEGLIWVDTNNKITPRLATEWTPNADATSYQMKLRPDVVWHDGKPFTADDVIYTLRAFGSGKPPNYAG